MREAVILSRRASILAIAVFVLFAVGSCRRPGSDELCSGEAWGECYHLLGRCGLTGNEPKVKLGECEPWALCDRLAFADCMTGNGG
jgi:hypothetical protein